MVGAIFELSDEKFGIVARLIVVRQSRCMQDAAFAAADDLVKSSRQRRRALRRYSHTPWNTCVPAVRGSTTISSSEADKKPRVSWETMLHRKLARSLLNIAA